jgi:phosphate transport system substrate-binding protein
MTRTLPLLRLGAALLALGALLAPVALDAPAARAASYVPITGSGSTWSQNALDQWRKNVAANYGMTVNYSGVGSSAGRRDFIAGSVDFAVSEIPFQSNPEDGSAPEAPSVGYAYMPIVAGGTAFMYNLKIGGKRVTNLRLSGDVVTKIFTGVITNWKDPAIQSDNPALAMPDKPIVPVVRSDGSGTSAQFSLWMSKQYPDLWNDFCRKVGRSVPCGLTSQYPVFGSAKAQNGSLGVAGYVSQDYGEGAITYVEYSYAIKSGFPVAKILNHNGYYVEPTAPSVAVALLSASINADLTQNLDAVYNSDDPRTYPLSSYSYMIIPTQVGGIFTEQKGSTLGAFARYLLCEGQQQAPALGYSPLPMNLVQAGSDQIKRIPGAGSAGIDFNSCNNPTFKPGDSPTNNRLAATAPKPADCDRKGTSQCTTGTAGAQQETAVTGTGKGGKAAGAATTTSGGATTAGSTSSGDVGDGTGDGATTGGAGNAVARPFLVADRGMGTPQWLMVAAGGLLLAVIIAPVLISRLVDRARKK